MIKVILLIIFPFFAYGQIQSTICPVKGDKNSHKFMALDSLKNRRLPGDSATVIPIEAFFSSGNTFTTDMYVQTTGIVKLVKYGGPETCQCHIKDKDYFDYHIEIIPDSGYTGKPMICEVNRFVRCITYDSLKQMEGKVVTITGWLFSDIEHKQNSVLDNPKGTNDWRQTCWEIHPVISIEVKHGDEIYINASKAR